MKIIFESPFTTVVIVLYKVLGGLELRKLLILVRRVLVGKPEGKRPVGRPRRRWEDNIKLNLQEMGGGGDWM